MALKILHTGDWHIGSYPGPETNGENARYHDVLHCLNRLVETAAKEKPGITIISGDIFHQARVWSDRGLKESRAAIQIIRSLSQIAPVVVLRGTPNHDSEQQFEMLKTAFSGDDSVSIITQPELLTVYTYDGQPGGGLPWIPILSRENHATEKPLATDEAQGKENPLLYRETRRESPAT